MTRAHPADKCISPSLTAVRKQRVTPEIYLTAGDRQKWMASLGRWTSPGLGLGVPLVLGNHLAGLVASSGGLGRLLQEGLATASLEGPEIEVSQVVLLGQGEGRSSQTFQSDCFLSLPWKFPDSLGHFFKRLCFVNVFFKEFNTFTEMTLCISLL